ncbi:MAG: hypothetical protein U0531_01235 [Dehalococcoidia bacterium]
MPIRISFEGIDGSGKSADRHPRTAISRTRSHRRGPRLSRVRVLLRAGDRSAARRRHPDATAGSLDPKSMALWYALDRWLDHARSSGEGVTHLLLNRYTLSNVVYQSMRSRRPEVRRWVDHLEHEVLNLPRPDAYIILDTPLRLAGANVLKKETRSYTSEAQDGRARHGAATAGAGGVPGGGRVPNARIVPSNDGDMLPPEVIGARVFAALTELGLA